MTKFSVTILLTLNYIFNVIIDSLFTCIVLGNTPEGVEEDPHFFLYGPR